MTLVNAHLVAALVDIDDLVDIFNIEAGIDPLCEHIVGDGQHINVAGPLAVAKERSLDALGPCEKGELGGGHTASAVIVRMDAEDDAVPVLEVPAHPFDLVGIDIGRIHFNSRRKVEDHRLFLRGLPDVLDGRADLKREIKLCACKALRRILEHEVAVKLIPAFLHPAGAVLGDLDDTRAVHVKDDVPLEGRCGIINMENDILASLDRFIGPVDLVFPALGENLDIDIIGDHVVVDQSPEKIILDLARRREADLDLLEAELDEKAEHFHLFTDDHRIDQGLIAVAQVDAAPDRRFLNLLVRPLSLRIMNYGIFGVLLIVKHFQSLHFYF